MIGRLARFRRGEKSSYEDLSTQDQGALSPSRSSSAVGISGRLELNTPSEQGTPSDSRANISFSEDTYTVDQAVDAIGFGKFQLKLSLFTGIVWMADAMEMMILSILAPALHCYWDLSPIYQALLTTVVFAGMMVSSGMWGKICDKYGRKIEMILCSITTFFYGLLSAFAPNFTWILILRGLVGFGIGGVPQSVTLYTEFLPSKARAKCVVLIEIFWAFGSSLIVFISIFVMPTLGWRYLLVFASLPLLLYFVACFWVPESARFDVARGRIDLAEKTLQMIAEENGKPLPLGRLVESESQPLSEVPPARGQLKDLFKPELRLTTSLLWFIWLANAFCYYGIVLMTTELFEVGDECHGGSAGKVVQASCGVGCKTLSTKDYIDLLWTTLAEFPGLVITFLIIENLGRRWTMAIEFFVFSFFVFLVNLCTSRFVLTIFLFIARAFISGAFQAAYVYTPEVYPTTTRALGLGACSAMARVGAIITPFVAQVLLRTSVTLAICTYGTVSLLSVGASLLLPIETKGRSMKETHVDPKKSKKQTHD
ncbi:hypothetical protein CAPTEDRAFT_220893 [Capitella teleta]|uniref:Major facilitator superfamily (MFS) profile domain-containing protein n=1 Tax=Capitella teleta TaxID=283909 RepID=R7VD71_CAPTE|nr:hypothetical protein CAPTEDRAFT_220893 [Capitella teleta]|eukprot:ELU14236.1 hypothetical protein CAPTEDRAFT_220893 [Capitella teleta]